jgi:hypothetical protein
MAEQTRNLVKEEVRNVKSPRLGRRKTVENKRS